MENLESNTPSKKSKSAHNILSSLGACGIWFGIKCKCPLGGGRALGGRSSCVPWPRPRRARASGKINGAIARSYVPSLCVVTMEGRSSNEYVEHTGPALVLGELAWNICPPQSQLSPGVLPHLIVCVLVCNDVWTCVIV